MGYLGEQLADLLATRELIAAAMPDDIGVSVSYPLPGTKFYEQVKAQLGEKTHWRDSDDLAMMFRGAYDSDFYRRVRDLMHAQITVQQSKESESPEHYRDALATLDGRWNALLSLEQQHRTEHAAAPATTSSQTRLLRHVATAQNR